MLGNITNSPPEELQTFGRSYHVVTVGRRVREVFPAGCTFDIVQWCPTKTNILFFFPMFEPWVRLYGYLGVICSFPSCPLVRSSVGFTVQNDGEQCELIVTRDGPTNCVFDTWHNIQNDEEWTNMSLKITNGTLTQDIQYEPFLTCTVFTKPTVCI